MVSSSKLLQVFQDKTRDYIPYTSHTTVVLQRELPIHIHIVYIISICGASVCVVSLLTQSTRGFGLCSPRTKERSPTRNVRCNCNIDSSPHGYATCARSLFINMHIACNVHSVYIIHPVRVSAVGHILAFNNNFIIAAFALIARTYNSTYTTCTQYKYTIFLD